MHAMPTHVGVESGFGNLVVELGIVGLILWIVLGFSISFSAWKDRKGAPGHALVSPGFRDLLIRSSPLLSR